MSLNVDVDIEACKQGEREALGNLYKAYSGRLLKVCQHYVADESAAEDILHDAFIIIFTSIKMLSDNSKLEAWMITIVRNLALKYLRSIKPEEIPLSCLAIDLPEEEDEEKRNVDLGRLLSAIESLPEGNREIFKLSVLDGLSHQEIGEQLGINPHSSSSQLFRAKKMLRSMLTHYWMLFLLPILIPVYLYLVKRDKPIENAVPETAVNARKEPHRRLRDEGGTSRIGHPVYLTPSSDHRQNGKALARTMGSVGEKPLQGQADHVEAVERTVTFDMDSLRRSLTTAARASSVDSSSLLQIPQDRMLSWNGDTDLHLKTKKKYPWSFYFGPSSNPSGNSMSSLNYLSVIDYANGGAAAKIYSWGDYVDYLDRNRMMMDSTENARLRQEAVNKMNSDDQSIGEKVHHDRPLTYSLSINKQLSPHWTFGTGLTYTRLKSEIESPFNDATLKKTQKIDYLGIPLRMTYSAWNKGRFNAYVTGGVTFEIPVHSSLTKQFVVTSDSSFTMKGTIHPHNQWSVNIGIGVQYQILKPFSFYIEPNLFYYFKNGSDTQTYWTEHPFTLSIPFGLRLTW